MIRTSYNRGDMIRYLAIDEEGPRRAARERRLSFWRQQLRYLRTLLGL